MIESKVSQSKQYVIELCNATKPCWISAIDGDPGRTLLIENAKVYTSKEKAIKAVELFNFNYSKRSYRIVKF